MRIARQKKIKNNRGQSIVEITIAMGIFSLAVVSLVSLLLGNFNIIQRNRELIKANFLAQEAMEAVRAVRDDAWNNLRYSSSAVTLSGGYWSLAGEGTSEQIGKFTRKVDFFDVYRDAAGDLSASGEPGARLDIQSKEVLATVEWNIGPNSKKIERRTYFTNWNSVDWVQTDWSGGGGQALWADSAKYDSDDGNIDISALGRISLLEIATSTFASSGALESSAFKIASTSNFNSIDWDVDIPADCSLCEVRIQIKTAPDSGGAPGAWISAWSGPDGDDGDETDYFSIPNGELIDLSHNSHEWLKYKVILIGDSTSTPVFKEIRINYKNI